MMKWSKSLVWVVLQTVVMVAVVVNLLSGLRIATLNQPWLLNISAILPQGNMHDWHVTGAILLLSSALGYGLYRLFCAPKTPKSKVKSKGYHLVVIYWGYLALTLLMLTGIGMYFNINGMHQPHYYAALALLTYLPLHAGVYFVQYGLMAIKLISLPNVSVRLKTNGAVLGIIALVMLLGFNSIREVSFYELTVNNVNIDTFIDIDGELNEPIWQQMPKVTVNTFGGSNFVDGQTPITVQGVHNGIEAFFHISWLDPDKSLKHLPLVKGEKGWQVQHQGFEKFDEQQYYEDKLAVILSDNCDFAAAGTAHLGPKPIANRPANFSGKGYHYQAYASGDNRKYSGDKKPVVDLWHWKAVRTNNMILADDNFIGPPSKARAGAKRYTAGYLPDAKEGGAYVMNWQWFKPEGIIPKRFPKNIADLASFQQPNNSTDWVIPWFAYAPFDAQKDTLPVGTVMPSVMYRSNRFEGDRADVRAFAKWHNGRWTMELSRKLITQSDKDIPLKDGICMWVAAFDHSQISHTRHVKPIKLIIPTKKPLKRTVL